MGQAASTPTTKIAGPPRRPRVSATAPIALDPPMTLPPSQNKRVIARNIKIEHLSEPPKDAGVYYFDNSLGRRMCWKLGYQTANEFMTSSGGISGSDLQFFKGSTLRVFFPTKRDSRTSTATSYATKTFKNTGSITLSKILRCVEVTAAAAVAHHLQAVLKQTRGTTTADVARVLRRVTVCHILLRRVGGSNQVYVRTTGSMGV